MREKIQVFFFQFVVGFTGSDKIACSFVACQSQRNDYSIEHTFPSCDLGGELGDQILSAAVPALPLKVTTPRHVSVLVSRSR